MAAIGFLLFRPDALTALAREQPLPFDLRVDAFSNLVEFLNPARREKLPYRCSGLPDWVRLPLLASIGGADPRALESQLFRANKPPVSRPNLPDRPNLEEVSSISLH